MTRTHDLVVWGATGVAGRLVASYLAERYEPETLSLALGGRDRARLEQLEARLTDREPAWDSIPLVLGDATDPASLEAIAADTAVVCTTVGPYTTYGTPMVAACVEHGTDYCDLTGEVTWARQMIDRFHEPARAAGARIVNSCGFDSVPTDLSTLLAQKEALATVGAPCERVRIYLEDAQGSVSGGTLASFAELFETAATDPEAAAALQNPYSLAPPGEREGPDPGGQRRPVADPMGAGWTAPSPMAGVNERVVRRSNALLGYPWGESFACTEVVPTGDGIGGAVGAAAVTGGLGLFVAAMGVGPIRAGLRRFVFPQPGEGPSETETTEGHFRVRARGTGETEAGEFAVDAIVAADRDPGYGATARMLAEAGICLLREETQSDLEGGVLTPASAIGSPLADRLDGAGFTTSAELVETP